MKFLHLPVTLLGLGIMAAASQYAMASEELPWGQSQPPRVITPGNGPTVLSQQATNGGPTNGGGNGTYSDRPYDRSGGDQYYSPAPREAAPGGGQPPYNGTGQYERRGNGQYGAGDRYAPSGQRYPAPRGQPHAEHSQRGFTSEEIAEAGRSFFGSISSSLARVIEYAFQKQGRPNGYILGEEAGGAFIAGLRYGEGTLYTRDAGHHKIYWQGPSLGYDFGAEGSKTMILVYNLGYPEQIYRRFSGVDGSAYLVGGVGITFQKRGDVVLAPIRSGVGLRLGANVGYLKYSRRPTWNPF